jgi:hypothetical protein
VLWLSQGSSTLSLPLSECRSVCGGVLSVLHFHLLCAVGLHHRGVASSTSKLYCVVDLCSVRPDSKKSRTKLRLGPFPLWDECMLFPILVPEMALVQVRSLLTSQEHQPRCRRS